MAAIPARMPAAFFTAAPSWEETETGALEAGGLELETGALDEGAGVLVVGTGVVLVLHSSHGTVV